MSTSALCKSKRICIADPVKITRASDSLKSGCSLSFFLREDCSSFVPLSAGILVCNSAVKASSNSFLNIAGSSKEIFFVLCRSGHYETWRAC